MKPLSAVLSIPCYSKSSCSALLPLLKLLLGISKGKGEQGPRELSLCLCVMGWWTSLFQALAPVISVLSSQHFHAGSVWLTDHDESRVYFVWVTSKVWRVPVWSGQNSWYRLRRSFRQGLRQEGGWNDSCSPVGVERNSHRSLWNPLLLPLESSQGSSITPWGQNTAGAAGRWWAISQGLPLPRAIRRNVLLSLQLCYLASTTFWFALN